MPTMILTPDGYIVQALPDNSPATAANLANQAIAAAAAAASQAATAQYGAQAANDDLAMIKPAVANLQTSVSGQATSVSGLSASVAALQVLSYSTTTHSIGSAGTASVTFTRSFDAAPAIAFGRIESSDLAGVVEFSIKSWIQDGNGKYTGAVVRARRQQLLPATITLLSSLQNFDVFGGSAVGVNFTCMAVQRTA